MDKQLSLPNCDENKTKSDREDAGYHAPELHEVGTAVELIQGAQWRGPYDHSSSWPIWPL